MSKHAIWIKDVSKDFRGRANLYRLTSPLDGHDYVVVSEVVAAYSGPETYIFGSDAMGNVLDWGELDGSYQGGMDGELALMNAGYEVS